MSRIMRSHEVHFWIIRWTIRRIIGLLRPLFVGFDDGLVCYSMEVCCYLCACQAY